jgi:phosphotransferase system HPr-like phosphotransfer protein
LALAGLDARADDRLIITGSGRQAAPAVSAVVEFVASGFDPQVGAGQRR